MMNTAEAYGATTTFETQEDALKAIGGEAKKRVESQASHALALKVELTEDKIIIKGDTDEKQDLRQETIEQTMQALGNLITHRRQLGDFEQITERNQNEYKETQWINRLVKGPTQDISIEMFHKRPEQLDSKTRAAMTLLEADADPLTQLGDMVKKVHIPTQGAIDKISTQTLLDIQTITGEEAGSAIAFLMENQDVIAQNPDMVQIAEAMWNDVKELAASSVFCDKSIKATKALQMQLGMALVAHHQTTTPQQITRKYDF